MSADMFDHDYLIIGSGFGGSVCALRLAEKGWNVAVVEQGLRGYFVQHTFRHVAIVGGGYRVTVVDAVGGRTLQTLTAKNVVLSAGVVGTHELLYRNRDRYRTLPRVSSTLGRVVRTNSEAITAVLHRKGEDMTDGTGISTDFHPDEYTHATQNRFDRGYRFLRMYMGPMVDDPLPWRRAIRTIAKAVLSPRLMLTNLFCRDWEKRITAFTIMQDLDNHIRLQYRRPWWWPFAPRLSSGASPGHEAPSYLPVANWMTREYAGLFVVDGSSIPANVGVNPSLTIAAMAERFAMLQPARG